jgi:hypothetical protein
VCGTLWLALNNARSGHESTQANSKILDTAQDAVARLGNDKTRDELIQARTRFLSGKQSFSESGVKDIIGQLPTLADEYNKLSQDKAKTVESMATDFQLCWGPLVYYTLSEFDNAVSAIKKELGEEGKSIGTGSEKFQLTFIEGSRDREPLNPTVRTLSKGVVHLYVSYSRAKIHPNR